MKGHYFLLYLMVIFNDVIIDNDNACSVYSNRIQRVNGEKDQSHHTGDRSFLLKKNIFMTFRGSICNTYITEI